MIHATNSRVLWKTKEKKGPSEVSVCQGHGESRSGTPWHDVIKRFVLRLLTTEFAADCAEALFRGFAGRGLLLQHRRLRRKARAKRIHVILCILLPPSTKTHTIAPEARFYCRLRKPDNR